VHRAQVDWLFLLEDGEMRGLKGKVAVVAGAGAGIGAATAERLAAEGMSVVLGNLTLAPAQKVAKRIVDSGGNAVPFAFDITDRKAVRELVRFAEETYGGLDLFHANAADTKIRLQDSDAVDVSLDVFDRTIAVNLRGHLICTSEAVPALLRRGGGAIIYTASDGAFFGEPQRVCYAISKAGLNALMRHVASRWGKVGIRANSVSPGLIQTETVLESHTESSKAAVLAASRCSRLGEPSDVAAMVAYLASDDATFINGQVLSVNGGLMLR
jgi:NAD(P)-dependent dehydrogenase (short-subunit alcohol dehydrogenase family)